MEKWLLPGGDAAISSERKDRTRLGLSKYAAEAADQGAGHRDKLGVARNMRDAAAVREISPNRFPSSRCASAIQIVEPSRSSAEKPQRPLIAWRSCNCVPKAKQPIPTAERLRHALAKRAGTQSFCIQ